jgi:hypothetical protein
LAAMNREWLLDRDKEKMMSEVTKNEKMRQTGLRDRPADRTLCARAPACVCVRLRACVCVNVGLGENAAILETILSELTFPVKLILRYM